MLLSLLILASLGYLGFGWFLISKSKGATLSREGDSSNIITTLIFSGGIPLIVAGTMAYLFLFVGGTTTVQFNTGSSSAMNVWSTWVGIWPLFLILTAGSSLAALARLTLGAFKKRLCSSLLLRIYSCFLSVVAFVTVFAYAPTA